MFCKDKLDVDDYNVLNAIILKENTLEIRDFAKEMIKKILKKNKIIDKYLI